MQCLFKKFVLAVSISFLTGSLFAQVKPLYQLPEELPEKNSSSLEDSILLGTDDGLFRVTNNGIAEPLWTSGKVDRILRTSSKWYFVTEKGIISSEDLKEFTECNNGLPFLTIKKYVNKQKSLEKKTPLLKDLSADPFNPEILVTATKDAVYLTKDGGQNWKSIGSMSKSTGGVKAVAVSHMPVYDSTGKITGTELVVFMTHPIYGFSYYRTEAAKPAWIDVSAGFSAMQSLTQPDEIADILPVMCKTEDGTFYSELYMTQTYIPNFYKFDWRARRAVKIYSGSEKADTMDGICQSGSNLVFATPGNISYLNISESEKTVKNLESYSKWKNKLNAAHAIVNSAYIPSSISETEFPLVLSELWLLKPDAPLSPWGDVANGKKSLYISAYQVRTMEGIQKYKKICKNNKLNSVVVDMKDDYGLLRFDPVNPLLKKKGKVTQYKINVDQFVSEFKKDDIYLIARVVVFKDRNLANYDKKQYAVWNGKKEKPWMGIKKYDEDENGVKFEGPNTSYYDENWVDPYSEEVWEYNVEIAKELISRGFDEIQFDYIRFPTDGLNMSQATFRWKDAGMDKESALVSFLSYARKNINAPIGVDIYGANGWYRTGARTGQDVELMSEYVDVICPMFYPSHFEQDFLEYTPAVERPYRIYFYGSYRNTVMGRNRIIVRPWIQAFYLGVRYDRAYYNKDYVKREIFGVRDGLDRGYMYWNNSGGMYDDISPDPEDNEMSPWKANEADLQKRIPAFSSGNKKPEVSAGSLSFTEEEIKAERERNKAMISILDTVLNEEKDSSYHNYSMHLLRIEPMAR